MSLLLLTKEALTVVTLYVCLWLCMYAGLCLLFFCENVLCRNVCGCACMLGCVCYSSV